MREVEVMASKDHEKAVCVLDASTYVGFWVVKKLLLKGYMVHAALQNSGINLYFFFFFIFFPTSCTHRRLAQPHRCDEKAEP